MENNIDDKIIELLKGKTYEESKKILEHCIRRIGYESTIN